MNPSTAGTLVQSTVATRDARSCSLSAPAPAVIQHVTLSAPDSLMTDHPLPLLSSDVVPAPGEINHPHRQLTDSALISAPAPSMTDYVLPPRMSGSQLDLTRAPSRTPAQPTYCSMYAVDVDHALFMTNSSQFSTMTADRRDLPMPLYTTPSVVPAVTSVVPTAVHTPSLLSSVAYAHQAPAGAFITHTLHGPAVAFSIGACQVRTLSFSR